jgi:hypothetical protein
MLVTSEKAVQQSEVASATAKLKWLLVMVQCHAKCLRIMLEPTINEDLYRVVHQHTQKVSLGNPIKFSNKLHLMVNPLHLFFNNRPRRHLKHNQ